MRSLLLLAALCCLVLSTYGSPISRQDESQDSKELARQSATVPGAPAPATDDEDDDDDDDDDDDVDLDIADDDDDDEDDDDDDDDDDDEEADDDDDEGDYLERFFEDILGEDEDDEDDDEPSAVVQPVVAPADTVAAAPAAAPAAAASSVEEVAAAAEEAEASEGEAADDEETPGQKEPANAEADSVAASSEIAAAAAPADEDDDDEDDDEIADALDPEDDDDDDDDEEDDDDDDDITDVIGGRNTSAKQARALTEEPNKKPATVPAIYIVKYNRFVDNILEKMNDILRKSYDPVSVKLQPIDANKKSNKPKKNKTKKTNKKKSSNKKKNTARGGADKKDANVTTAIPEKMDKEEIVTPAVDEVQPTNSTLEHVQNVTSESRASKDKIESTKAKPTTTKPKGPTKATKPKPKPKPKPPTKVTSTTKKPVTKNKIKSTNEKSKPRAKGTLYGLSSLRRTGDVAVSIMSDHTTVKSNFAVGPLILRVEKEVGRGAKKELKSATATTAEMSGKLSLRVNNQGVATLHSIKVLQPKQVRVDSNHERTRELVWRRSSRIAHVVSEKLLSASKPMFRHQTVVKQ